jgi:hypothetical protein
MSDVLFQTSLYGRFGHLVMAVAGLVTGLLFAVPFLLPGPSKADLLVLAGCCLLGSGCLIFGLYSAWFALAPSRRIRFDDHALVYRGGLDPFQ